MFYTRGDRKQTSVSLQNSTVRSAEVLLSDKAICAPRHFVQDQFGLVTTLW